jgi:queuosine precursor transporter
MHFGLNELIWIFFLIADMFSVVLVFKFFQRDGLFALIIINVIVCNIQVLKMVEFFGYTTALGNILYGSIYLCTDILGEVYGKKHAKRGVWLGFVAIALMTFWLQITLLYKPAPEDFSQEHLVALFRFLPRIAVASFTAYLLSQNHDVWAFHFIKDRTGNKWLWLRNNAATIVSQFIDNTIFTMIAFWGVFEWSVIVSIFVTSYIMKMIIALCDTPFVYWAKAIAFKNKTPDMVALEESDK